MIFVDSIAQLQQNNLCPRQDLYFQPVISAPDISLQGFLAKQIQNDYAVEVQLTSWQGDEYIADVTGLCRVLLAVSVFNQNYFNIQLREFSPAFPEFFTLKVVIKNNGFTIFSKVTEPYRRIPTDAHCYAVIDDFAWMVMSKAGFLKIGDLEFSHGQGLQDAGFRVDYSDGSYYVSVGCGADVVLGYCYRGEDIRIAVPLITQNITDDSGCAVPLVKIQGSYNCEDNVSGHYFGDPKILLNYKKNDKYLRYQNTFLIYGEIKTAPTEIKKTSTFYGKPQRVEYIPKFELAAFEVFPDWKMVEIESAFSARRFYVQGVEYIYRGGKIFDKDDISNTCSWKMKASLEGVPKINDFSCIEECNTNCIFFVIPAGDKDQAYYTEDRELIGFNFSDLLDYFRALPDAISVEDFPILGLECSVTAVVRFDTFGIAPSFIYFREKLNENKIFARYDSCTAPKTLCEGVSACLKPYGISSEFSTYVGCAEVPADISGYYIDLASPQAVQPLDYYNGWTAARSSVRIYNGTVTLDFEIANPNLSETAALDFQSIMKLPQNAAPSVIRTEEDDENSFAIETDGTVSVTGYGNKLTFKINYQL